MGDYSRFINDKRRSVPAPQAVVRDDGSCVFGTFADEFEDLDLVRAARPTHAPQFMNKLKLTLWEAAEVHFDEGVLLCALTDMGVLRKMMHVFWEKETGRVYSWDTDLSPANTRISENLINGSTAAAKSKDGFIKYVNTFDKGRCSLSGVHIKGRDTVEYDLDLTRISRPSVVSIPFGSNRPLYTEKDFFRVTGCMRLNGRELTVNENTTAVIDDHRGYYPRHAHFDWVTTFGRSGASGEMNYFALNLTANQSTDPERYNENLIWLAGETALLPPVRFTRTPDSGEFAGRSVWTIRDDHDMVDLTFRVQAVQPMIVHALVVKIDYYIVFGELAGYLHDEAGHKYVLDGLMGMGEDKTLLL
ncbi:MAG: DUF2804 domain-containing protein [Eubacteriaceae bacterium]|nr:DUF2804 domain-containing protein [Eubacteriaceae bacterium]